MDFFEEGLPGQQVLDIEQTADGYLWVATNAGLARFDGHRFVTFDSSRTGIPDVAAITSLHRSPQDTLFIAQSDGPIVSYAGGRFETRLELGPDVHTVDSFVQDRAGRLIGEYGVPDGDVGQEFLREDRGALRRFPRRLPERLMIKPLYRDSEGRVWAGAELNEQVLDENQSPCAMNLLPAWRIQVLDDGQLVREPSLFSNLVVHPSRGEVLRSARSGNGVAFTSVDGEDRGRFVLPPRACPMLLDRDGSLWVQEDHLLVAYAPEEPTPLFRADLGFAYRYNILPPILEDQEGTLWVGTRTRGLVRVRRTLFQTYVTSAVDGHAPVTGLAPGASRSVLIADANQDLFRARGTNFLPVAERVAGWRGEGVYEDEQGRRLYFTRDGVECRIDRWIDGQPPTLVVTLGRIGGIGLGFYPDPRDPDVVWFHNEYNVYRLRDPFGA
ncbi:MAG: two-component regulator propeller domain-containing protein, partial [Rubricoccaceae bacterium]|nr:two-component regulator propeller domain-containing protein [Rubricoccaceae bacterium]